MKKLIDVNSTNYKIPLKNNKG